MIDKLKDEPSEMAMKPIYSSMKELNKKMLEMMKRKRTLGESELTYMSVQDVYLKLQVMEKENTVPQKIINCMVETRLEAHGGDKFERNELEERMNDEGGRRCKRPITLVIEINGFGRRATGVGGVDEYGMEQACNERAEVQHERAQKREGQHKVMENEQSKKGRWVYEGEGVNLEINKT